jgi:hypothetical protein
VSIKKRLDKLEGGNNELTIIVVRPDETEAEALQRYQDETGRNPTGRVVLVETGVPEPDKT